MILPIQHSVRQHMADAVRRLYDIPATDPVLASIPVEIPPRRALGDLAVPLAFELARRLRKAPRVIAQEIVASLGTIEGVSRIEAAPNGYVNVFLDRPAQTLAWLQGSALLTSPTERGKTIVEHTAINPNKAAHIGHLRNAALGDAFGRLLRFLGRDVEIQNYIDDTGVQVADVAVAFRELEGRSLEDVGKLADSSRFDYHCWDLYARITEWYRGTRRGSRPGAPRFTRSNGGAILRPIWPPSSLTGSCGATSRRCDGSTSGTTCSPGKETSCVSISGLTHSSSSRRPAPSSCRPKGS